MGGRIGAIERRKRDRRNTRFTGKPHAELAVRFPAEIMDGIDAIIAERFGQADRTAIIRELVAEALQGRKRK